VIWRQSIFNNPNGRARCAREKNPRGELTSKNRRIGSSITERDETHYSSKRHSAFFLAGNALVRRSVRASVFPRLSSGRRIDERREERGERRRAIRIRYARQECSFCTWPFPARNIIIISARTQETMARNKERERERETMRMRARARARVGYIVVTTDHVEKS